MSGFDTDFPSVGSVLWHGPELGLSDFAANESRADNTILQILREDRAFHTTPLFRALRRCTRPVTKLCLVPARADPLDSNHAGSGLGGPDAPCRWRETCPHESLG